MSTSLKDIAHQLKDSNKKVQLIYAFNGIGKTRLSREFKELIAPSISNDNEGHASDKLDLAAKKILYYSAFTEDLFYWDNDLKNDEERKLNIHPNSFTNWLLVDQGQDQNIIANFQYFTSRNITPIFAREQFNAGEKRWEDYNGSDNTLTRHTVKFSFSDGNETIPNIKISKGEESIFIWSIFYRLLNLGIETLNIVEKSQRETTQFNQLEYFFIDDPVTSLDENNLIELAFDLARLICTSESKQLQFIVTTHNPLFYNVLYNELSTKNGYILSREESGTFKLEGKEGAENTAFSYHLNLMEIIKRAIKTDNIQRYHFMLLRNLYEKTANFLGYSGWADLLPSGSKQAYHKYIVNFNSHSNLSSETVAEPNNQEKRIVKFLLHHLEKNYSNFKQEEHNE